MKNKKKKISLLLMLVLVISILFHTNGNVEAAGTKTIQLNKKSVTLKVGDKTTLKAKNVPAGKKISWKSNKKTVASVTSKGVVTAKKQGKAKITATIAKKQYSCSVTVKKKKKSVVNNKKDDVTHSDEKDSKDTAESNNNTSPNEEDCKDTTESDNSTSYPKEEDSKDTTESDNNTSYPKEEDNKDTTESDNNTSYPEEEDNKDTTESNNNTSYLDGGQSDTSSNNEDKNNSAEMNANYNTLKEQRDINDCRILLYGTEHPYTAEPITPKVYVADRGVELVQDSDYTVSYANNVAIGTGTITITGMNNYKGTTTRNFTITKAKLYASLDRDYINVGEQAHIQIKGKGVGTVTYDAVIATPYAMYGYYSAIESEYVTIDDNGVITANKAGEICIIVKTSGNEYYEPSSEEMWLRIINNTNPCFGFTEFDLDNKVSWTTDTLDTVVQDGMTEFSVTAYSDATVQWVEQHTTFTVEDVTPKAYHQTFEDVGMNMTAPSFIVEPAKKEVHYANVVSQKEVKITAGEGVRVVKVCIYKDGELAQCIYCATNPKDSEGNLLDKKLYETVRHRVEKKLWTDDMDNLEKLMAAAQYIRETCHYPNSWLEVKELNPTYWENKSVDNQFLFEDKYRLTYLHRAMIFRGGTANCTVVGILDTMVTEDLGMSYLENEDGSLMPGEGIWIGCGKNSSNPHSLYHETLYYRYADGKTLAINVQGMGGNWAEDNKNNSCTVHDCESKIISIKE